LLCRGAYGSGEAGQGDRGNEERRHLPEPGEVTQAGDSHEHGGDGDLEALAASHAART